jgi:hypothetical protein
MPCDGETRDASNSPLEVATAVPNVVINSRVRGSLQKTSAAVGAVVCEGTEVCVNAGIGVNVWDAAIVGCVVEVGNAVGEGAPVERLHAASTVHVNIIKSVFFKWISFIK